MAFPNISASAPTSVGSGTSIHIDDSEYKVVEIRATGDVLLDVTFENTNACNKSIPSDAIQRLRASKATIPSVRVIYRVRLETLKKQSQYFTHLLGSDVFGEGRAIKDIFSSLNDSNLKPSEVEPSHLPRIKILDEDDATRTMGREVVFRDMLRIIHGAEHLTKPVNIHYLSILVVMADRFDCSVPITRYVTGTFASFKYPQTLDNSAEEILRQKILLFYRTNQATRLAAATKELILRGSSRWVTCDEIPAFSTAWWDLPDGLEAELLHRRASILRTIASLQLHFLELYTSRNRQCSLGYDSSPACDSFQLGEMTKFLTRKGLLSLIPFQAVSPEDPEYLWPEPYTGDIEQLIGLLRQCPSYQLDKNHSHCGLRSKILPGLEYIRDCIDTGIGIKAMRWKQDRPAHTWIPSKLNAGRGRKPFTVGDEEDVQAFNFMKARTGMELGAHSFNADNSAKSMFTAKKWIWTPDREEQASWSSRPSLKF